MLPEKIPDFYRKLIEQDQSGALAKMMCFSKSELMRSEKEQNDPFGEQNNQKITNLIHLYPKKVLIETTQNCFGNCRFCFRKNWREEAVESDFNIFQRNIAEMKAYLETEKKINEVIFSGGDPLTLEKEKWLSLREMLLSLEQIKIWRWHTRGPVIDPKAINEWWETEWRKLLDRGKELVIVLHVNRVEEVTRELNVWARKARELGAKIKAQGVLLAGVNDRVRDLVELWQREIEVGIEPYYLHHLDRAPGTSHFWVEIERGKELFRRAQMRMLKNYPEFELRYVVEMPAGRGKVEVLSL